MARRKTRRTWFQDWTVKWWEWGFIKVTLFSIGLIIGSQYPEWIDENLGWIAIIFVVGVTVILNRFWNRIFYLKD